MFFGFKPSEKTLKNVSIKKESFRVCSEHMGKCRGEVPFKKDDGTTEWKFVYLDMREDATHWDYLFAMRIFALYDNGRHVTKYTAIVGSDTYCWSDE